jgi:hypothetical protein
LKVRLVYRYKARPECHKHASAHRPCARLLDAALEPFVLWMERQMLDYTVSSTIV